MAWIELTSLTAAAYNKLVGNFISVRVCATGLHAFCRLLVLNTAVFEVRHQCLLWAMCCDTFRHIHTITRLAELG